MTLPRSTSRVLVHRRFLSIWNELPSRASLANAQQFGDPRRDDPGPAALASRRKSAYLRVIVQYVRSWTTCGYGARSDWR
jgi:hypothetical protein